ncbi:MAG: DapH/DapD/GlmU-related protein [Victivallaceae bacterium]|nr:DapH/DapD/GlmU-related protein [Victivallaceae bacterium]
MSKKYKIFGGGISRLNRLINSCDIPATADIHESVIFDHNGLGVIVHNRARIMANTKIESHVVIGGRSQLGVPIIGKNVFIGCHAVILGNVTIGDNARIGAGAIVLSDVPANHTAVGCPAKCFESDPSHIVK